MRIAAMTLIAALGLGAAALSAGAAPFAPAAATPQASKIVPTAGGCGRGFHPDPWGRCVSNRYGYYPPRGYGGPGYYGGGYGYEPWNRPSPSDHVARELNRQELGRLYYGY